MTFDRQIAPLLLRIADAERNEEVLGGRVASARARSVDVVNSVELLAGQFPDVEVQERPDGPWLLQPISKVWRERWRSRYGTICETECPALAAATESATARVGSIEVQRSSLAPRTEAARRSRPPSPPVVEPPSGWRRLLGRLAGQRQQKPLPPREIGLDDALMRITALAEAVSRIEQQQTKFQLLESELQRVKQFLDEFEAQRWSSHNGGFGET
jgi:hypothetical protein